VAAAADLAPLQGELSGLAAAAPVWTFASSGLLARQIAAGAPFDVYLSANTGFVEELERQGLLVAGSVRVYASGRLGLWSSTGKIKTLRDLLRPEVRHIAIANPAHAPYGLAARQLLTRNKLWDSLQSKLVYAENVRQAYEFARTGNADAVITSWTLLHGLEATLLAQEHEPIRQAGAVVKSSKNGKAARAFLDALCGAAGRKILSEHGLEPGK